MGEALEREARECPPSFTWGAVAPVGILGEGPDAIVEHSELPEISREMQSVKQGLCDIMN